MVVQLIFLLFISQINTEKWAYILSGTSSFSQECNCQNNHGIDDDSNKGLWKQKNAIILTYDDDIRNKKTEFYKLFIERSCMKIFCSSHKPDYENENITSDVIFGSLFGNNSHLNHFGSGKTLKMSKEDNLLLYISGFGSKYMIGIRNNLIDADDLVHILKFIKSKCNYLFVVLDASMSASLINGKINIYDKGIIIMTSTGVKEHATVNYVERNGDVSIQNTFSKSFFKYLEQADYSRHTIHDLFSSIKSNLPKNNANIFGDKDMMSFPLGMFVESNSERMNQIDSTDNGGALEKIFPIHSLDREMAEMFLQLKLDDTQASQLLYSHQHIERFFYGLKGIFQNEKKQNVDVAIEELPVSFKSCYRSTRDFFFEKFEHSKRFPISYYYMEYLSNLCSQAIDREVIISKMKNIHRLMSFEL